MDTRKLKTFAQQARRELRKQTSAKLEHVLATGSPARRESARAVDALATEVAEHGKEQVIDRVAYTWFNRFCALRFMDLKDYTRSHVVSGASEEQLQPEILADAKAGHIDEARVPEATARRIRDLLGGRSPSHDPDQEAYRLLLVAECNHFHRAMPYLFQRIDDYTELLMPGDLLSAQSVLAQTRAAMTPENCQDVEVIGWLYQFYISEKKDKVFAELKKGKKITSANIPAATQLFTPHWIVRYLLENSLGRLWMLNHPESALAERMQYYIPEEVAVPSGQEPLASGQWTVASESSGAAAPASHSPLATSHSAPPASHSPLTTNHLLLKSPEEIRICDPACGSGHMLTYAFDLLYAIYEEVGTDPGEIPEKILTHNLYGIELDERAGELAAFALTMKARARQRRFFRKAVKPNICVLENVHFEDDELADYMADAGKDLFTAKLRETLTQFEEADNFGSLIQPALTRPTDALHTLEQLDIGSNLFLAATHRKVLKVLRMADYLSPRYQVVVANPPYMGSKGMNGRLKVWAKKNYPDSKADLFAMFIERNLDMARTHGCVAMITMQSWMFLSSFEALRNRILGQHTIVSMAHLGARAFDSIGGEVVSTTAFVLENRYRPEYRGAYVRLVDGSSEAEKAAMLEGAIQ